MNRILTVIPVHNRREMTLNILSNIQALQISGFILDVLIIDDGSTDGTSDAVQSRFPSVKIERGDGNLWWGGALNVGFHYALKHSYDYIYTINDDIVLREDTLTELFKAAQSNPANVCGSVILRENGLISSAGYSFSSLFGKIQNHWRNRSYSSLTDDYIPCQTLSTQSVLFPCDVLKRGIFADEKHFPQNFTDYDFFDTVRKRGFELVVVRRSVIQAGESASQFHYFIMSHSTAEIISSFFGIKYGNNLKNQWNVASRNTNILFATIRFAYFVAPSIAWLTLRLILPRTWLEAVLIFFHKYERSSNVSDEVG